MHGRRLQCIAVSPHHDGKQDLPHHPVVHQQMTSHIDHLTDGSLETWEEHNGWKHHPHHHHGKRLEELLAESRRPHLQPYCSTASSDVRLWHPSTLPIRARMHATHLEHLDPTSQGLSPSERLQSPLQTFSPSTSWARRHALPHLGCLETSQPLSPLYATPASKRVLVPDGPIIWACDYHEMNKQVVDHDFLTTTDQSEAAHRVRLRMHAAERKEREKRENHDFARGFEAVVNAAGDIMTVLSGEVDSLSRPDKGPSGLEWASSDASSRIKNKLVTAMMHGTTSPPLTLHEPLHGVRTGGAGLRA